MNVFNGLDKVRLSQDEVDLIRLSNAYCLQVHHSTPLAQLLLFYSVPSFLCNHLERLVYHQG